MGAAGSGRWLARYVWASPGRLYAPGELVVSEGRVVAIGRCRARRGVEDVAILPGLVDAHAHLQIPPLRPPERDFVPWIQRLMAARAASTDDRHEVRAEQTLWQLLRSGTTAVGEVDSTGRSPAALRRVPLAGRCYRELTGFDLDPIGARRRVAVAGVVGTRSCPRGLSPHAPYSVSAALFRAARRSGLPLMVHAAETEAEQRFLRSGDGPFARLLERLGRLPQGHRAPGMGAVAWLDALGVLGRRTCLVHCQHLESGDIDRIRRRNAAIAVCPGTIEYFGRSAVPVARWLAGGVPVALGTDSRASCSGELSMRRDMARARRLWPQLAPSQVLAMATVHGARALARPGLGALRCGGRADFLVVATAAAQSADEVLEAFTTGHDATVDIRLLGEARVPAGTARR